MECHFSSELNSWLNVGEKVTAVSAASGSLQISWRDMKDHVINEVIFQKSLTKNLHQLMLLEYAK